jgi:tetratricopeptide (TPR) repeat protein
MYGPLAMQRFMGLNGVQTWQPPVIIANKAVADDAIAQKPKVRISNAAMKEQAGKFMAFGDANFQKQNFNSALERYRSASQVASDVPETFLRQGFALVAMGRFESASKVMRRALLLQPDATKLNLQLNDLYGENQMAKTAHLEALADGVDQNPQSADLLLLLGLQLYFDGQADRSLPVFQRCAQLGGNDDGSLTVLMRKFGEPAAKLAKEI